MPDTDFIICAFGELLGSIIHGVELSNFVSVTDLLEKSSNLLTGSLFSEIVLLNTKLGVVRWEKEIDSLWFVTIVLKKC